MIVEFSVANFRSIHEMQTISFVATGLKSSDEYKQVDAKNISTDGDIKLMKTIGIYGANGSGKSNILKALDYFMSAIIKETSTKSNLHSLFDPFLYQENKNETESFFQIALVLEGKKYRYGFTVKRQQEDVNENQLSTIVIGSEWLFGPKDKNMRELFTRNNLKIGKSSLPNKGKIPELLVRHNLFLTYAAAFDPGGICSIIRKFFMSKTLTNLRFGFKYFRANALDLIEIEGKNDRLLAMLEAFNLKYNSVIIERDETDEEVLSHDKVFLTKSFVGAEIKLNLKNNESSGTQKLFDLVGTLYRAFNLNQSTFIIIDEIDSTFHPGLLVQLIKLFNDPTINHNNSQLMFSSHDTNLMSPEIMRRDQFYFAEKQQDESTRIYSLADLRGIRNDANFAKDYLAGYYGALPIMETFIDTNTIRQDGSLEH